MDSQVSLTAAEDSPVPQEVPSLPASRDAGGSGLPLLASGLSFGGLGLRGFTVVGMPQSLPWICGGLSWFEESEFLFYAVCLGFLCLFIGFTS